MKEAARTNFTKPLVTRICVCCKEKVPDPRQFPCGCFWCRNCLERYLEFRIAESYRWPPMCCQFVLRDEDVEWIQSSTILEEYRKIDREKRKKPPLYCSQEQCKAILDTQNTIEGSDIIVCDKCKSKTCQKCHQGHEPIESGCKGPPKDAKLEALIRREGWQKCSRCNYTISRTTGCSHMTCYCGHEFCYNCGSTWRTCDCTGNLDDALYVLQQPRRGPLIEIERDAVRLIGRQDIINYAREARRIRRQRAQEEEDRIKKENQHPGQTHDDHASSTPSEETYRLMDATPGQSQDLPYRQRPEPLIENPLRSFSPSRGLTPIPESSLATYPPQNAAVESLLDLLSLGGPPETGPYIDIVRPRRHRIQSPLPEVPEVPEVPDLSLPYRSAAQRALEATTIELPTRQPIAPPAGRNPRRSRRSRRSRRARRALAASRGDSSQIHDPLPTEQNTPTEPGSRPESTPQDEVLNAPSPSTPPSQLSPSTPSNPPAWSPRSH
ncbi:hypothetical protein F4813DRAFT_399458 [Daldinia decipiens]|uniref:uncharacterized protein n=1 Tax=Daldinia decipiens TaxID=326647 RepID=UPI0020C2C210|nr:uncharacterized protein F4813DRAFT_399458 [Daldinia decipiens]KAI1654093.1 hypothetical protein F4813DRAFT_399458 [Daldinia decipiens]